MAAALTAAVAWLSWNLFEKHFLKLKKFFPVQAAPGAPAGRADGG